jgi:hypothetical protein
MLRDPDGHTLWFGRSYDQPCGPAARPLLEKALPELPCNDVAAAIAHYRDVLGFRINYSQHDLGVMDRDNVTVLLIARMTRHTGIGSADFYIADADALHAELRAKGSRSSSKPARDASHRRSWCVACRGAAVAQKVSAFCWRARARTAVGAARRWTGDASRSPILRTPKAARLAIRRARG